MTFVQAPADTLPSAPHPVVPIERIWHPGGREEVVRERFGEGEWRISDMQLAVKDQPVFELPLCCIDLGSHDFGNEGGLIGFARHMLHVNQSDPDVPVILDEWGRVIDGRHRLVKALLEGRVSVRAQRIPPGTLPTSRS